MVSFAIFILGNLFGGSFGHIAYPRNICTMKDSKKSTKDPIIGLSADRVSDEFGLIKLDIEKEEDTDNLKNFFDCFESKHVELLTPSIADPRANSR